jgi:hypothetical protein
LFYQFWQIDLTLSRILGKMRVLEDGVVWMIAETRVDILICVSLCLTVLVAFAPGSVRAERIAAYVFDGTPGTQSPNMVEDVGGDTNATLTIRSSAQYNVSAPFGGLNNTSLDVLGGIQDRASNDDTDVAKFSNNVPWSVTAWLNNSLPGRYRQIVSQRTDNTGNGWYLGLTSASLPSFFIQGQAGPDARGATGNTALEDGQWHMITAVYDPNADADGEIRLYVDGSGSVFTHHKTQTNSIDYGTSVFAVGLGLDTGGSFNQFAGLVDEVALFDHALTADEVDFYFGNSVSNLIEVSFSTIDVADTSGFEFQSVSGSVYRLDKAMPPSTNFTSTGGFLEGNGDMMLMFDPTGFSTQDVYKIFSL